LRGAALRGQPLGQMDVQDPLGLIRIGAIALQRLGVALPLGTDEQIESAPLTLQVMDQRAYDAAQLYRPAEVFQAATSHWRAATSAASIFDRFCSAICLTCARCPHRGSLAVRQAFGVPTVQRQPPAGAGQPAMRSGGESLASSRYQIHRVFEPRLRAGRDTTHRGPRIPDRPCKALPSAAQKIMI